MHLLASSFFHLDWRFGWLVVAAFLGGTLNAVAGGGSFLLFPALLSMNILPIQANATNTVALWPGQLTSIAAYRVYVQKHLRLALLLALAGLLGGVSGATLLLRTPQMTFLHLVPWLLLFAALLFAASSPVSRWLQRRKGARVHTHGPRHLPVFLATVVVCFYIGYFGAGAGFLLITLFTLFGFEDMNEVNALKVVSTTMANGMAFLLFVINGQVVWHLCLLAMVTCAIGGYTSASLARRIPQPVLRVTVVLIGLGMAGWFFWKTR